jgi:hypothetical protein
MASIHTLISQQQPLKKEKVFTLSPIVTHLAWVLLVTHHTTLQLRSSSVLEQGK